MPVSPSPVAQSVYVDTSVWTALLTQEAAAPRIAAWMSQGWALCTANWTAVELASGLAIKARRGEFSQQQVAGLCERYGELLDFDLLELLVIATDMRDATRYCQDVASGLRASDALHLAIARRVRCSHFFSLDNLLNRNARAAGLQLIEI